MAVEKQTQQRPVPSDIIAAVDAGELISQEELRSLIEVEAEWIGLSFDEAVGLGRRDQLPKSDIGTHLWFLIRLLDD